MRISVLNLCDLKMKMQQLVDNCYFERNGELTSDICIFFGDLNEECCFKLMVAE